MPESLPQKPPKSRIYRAHHLVADAHGQHARKGGRGSEQAVGHLHGIADNHLHGERLTERIPKQQKTC